MKYLFSLLLSLLCYTIYAQNTTTDTSATCVAYWNKGDQKIFQVKHAKLKTEGGQVVSSSIVSYEAHLKVLEATDEGYTLEWSHHNYNPGNADAQTTQVVNALMSRLKFRYKTDEVGSFVELLNWQEVRDFNVKLLELSLSKQKDEAVKKAVDRLVQMYQTKERIEGAMIKEIQLYHTPFGVEFNLQGQQVAALLPNMSGGEPFPATIALKLSSLSPSEDKATIDYTQNIDKGKASRQIADFLRQLAPDADKEKGIDPSLFSQLEIADASQFQLTLSTGWLTRASVKRTSQIGQLSQVETYEIVEKK